MLGHLWPVKRRTPGWVVWSIYLDSPGRPWASPGQEGTRNGRRRGLCLGQLQFPPAESVKGERGGGSAGPREHREVRGPQASGSPRMRAGWSSCQELHHPAALFPPREVEAGFRGWPSQDLDKAGLGCSAVALDLSYPCCSVCLPLDLLFFRDTGPRGSRASALGLWEHVGFYLFIYLLHIFPAQFGVRLRPCLSLKPGLSLGPSGTSTPFPAASR